MLVCCVGDSVLDILVSVEGELAHDDDVPAQVRLVPGGQAVNVAAWVRRAGGTARYLGPRSTDSTGRLLDQAMADRGITTTGPAYDRAPGAVLSIISGPDRSMASDAGALGWPREVLDSADLSGADWLMVSAYTIYRLGDTAPLVELCQRADAGGVRVAVDLSSARMLRRFGAHELSDLLRVIAPTMIFANEAEWGALSPFGQRSCDLALKRNARGCIFQIGDSVEARPSVAAEVVDTTGAGDALAAGFLVGGPDLAMRLAAECVAQVGAQPPLTDCAGPPTAAPARPAPVSWGAPSH